jgi:signal transduction histidine kinase
VELAAIVGAAGAVGVAVVASVGWRRALRAAHRANQRADRAEALRRDEQVVAEEDRRVRDLILSTMDDGILLIGRDAEVVFANAAVGRHLSPEPTSLDGVLPLALRTAIQGSRERGGSASVLVETGVPTRWLRGTITPAADDATLVVVQDVTQERQLESVRRDFVANASHELKTPAASIQAAAETIRTAAAEDPSVIPRFASQLEREAARLSRIVSDLLDLSRLESGSVLDEVVALDAIVRDEGERFEDPAAEAGVGLSVAAAAVPRVRGSARDLALLVRNLVDNAIRYTPSGGKVHVELTSDGANVVLAVADTGLGIPHRDLPRIFERFYRVDRARSRETGGTGLGLSIVKHVAENLGGRVEVTSELGQGTRFEVRLPASP